MRLRPLSLAALGFLIGLEAFGPAVAIAQNGVVDRAYAIDAPALSGLKIDGDISDWPAAMPRYALRTLQAFPNNYGLGGLEKLDLTTNADLSACFMAGYDPKEQVIHLAIIVRDDALIVGHKSAFDTDAIEIFIDGLRSEKMYTPPAGDWSDVVKAEAMPVLQYVGVPGPGPFYKNKSEDSLVLQYGDIKKTKSKLAFSRKGDVTIYELSLQPFDEYPGKPTKLEAGKRIGFDLVVVDKDVPAPDADGDVPEADRPVWLAWGLNPSGFKGFNAGNLGELVLGVDH